VDRIAEGEVAKFGGRLINTTGDGHLATFDGPGKAIRCARALVEAVKSQGIELRAGLHTGEVELRGNDVGGIAVHIGARVSALAGPSEVLVSRTVADLVAGSGIPLEDRGEQSPQGYSWRVAPIRGRGDMICLPKRGSEWSPFGCRPRSPLGVVLDLAVGKGGFEPPASTSRT